MLLLLGSLAACESLPRRHGAGLDNEPGIEDQDSVLTPTPVSGLDAALDRMQQGDAEAARRILSDLEERQPGSAIVRMLIRQIDMPAAELLPGPYREIEVRPGDSLAGIAERELGNPLLFYALGRLNGIDVPRLLAVGMRLKLPLADVPRQPPFPDATAAEVKATPADLETLAEYLAASGQADAGRKILLASMGTEAVSDSTVELLLKLTFDEVDRKQADGQFAAALAIVAATEAVLDEAPARARLASRRRQIEADHAYHRAVELQRSGDWVNAYEMAQQSLSINPSSKRATNLEAVLRQALVDHLHDQALRAWRDREVDSAIDGWQMLLEIVPTFEPARIYLDRALRLRERLEAIGDAQFEPQAG
ncbi:MAG: LysM domain-containing protein [Wenzhouxiangellaceae bacterium]|nr:LysM domain-containing protein [Wenzhouxiangellaceae bacterium]